MRGDRLRELRLEHGYTQISLAKELHIGERQIWRYENEETVPDGTTVAQIAKMFDVTTDYLLGLSDTRRPYRGDQLSQKEAEALSAWRSGDKVKAVKVILDD